MSLSGCFTATPQCHNVSVIHVVSHINGVLRIN